jgi:NitT/TauT family transport system substrate-binding protein
MTDARWKEFFDLMVAAGVYKPDLDWHAAYTLQFVNKGVGK